ncbi:MAG: hypothetical protein H0V92_13595, partial [Pseudonocardiales bacterium]|nr:hypothetical protein [Pseudonocardiales bacterium]
MTALASSESRFLGTPEHLEYSSEDAIRDSAWMLRSIGLDALVEAADLQTRVDRKYFVPAEEFR